VARPAALALAAGALRAEDVCRWHAWVSLPGVPRASAASLPTATTSSPASPSPAASCEWSLVFDGSTRPQGGDRLVRRAGERPRLLHGAQQPSSSSRPRGSDQHTATSSARHADCTSETRPHGTWSLFLDGRSASSAPPVGRESALDTDGLVRCCPVRPPGAPWTTASNGVREQKKKRTIIRCQRPERQPNPSGVIINCPTKVTSDGTSSRWGPASICWTSTLAGDTQHRLRVGRRLGLSRRT
jgi:hypothetical protein